MSICSWLKNRINTVKIIEEEPAIDSAPVPPVLTVEEDFFNVDQLFEIMKYEDAPSADKKVMEGCEKYCKALNTMFKQYNIISSPSPTRSRTRPCTWRARAS